MEQSYSIYQDIARRTDGDIYIGVIGPVRTGKSTFIKRFMETQVIPNIDNEYRRVRAIDELPQSGSGRTIMTAEPKFVPEEAVTVDIGPASFSVRLIDCVGYLVDGALGQFEDDLPRMVTTPWYDHQIPMSEAAELGTRKVIADHSTIGLVVTTDGSITDIARADYVPAEERVINELKELGKPFLILLNSTTPLSLETQNLAASLAKKYDVGCLAVDCLNIGSNEIEDIIRAVLYEFPVREINLYTPQWAESLGSGHWLNASLYQSALSSTDVLARIRDVSDFTHGFDDCEYVTGCATTGIDLGEGVVSLTLDLPREIFYRCLREESGFEIENDGALLPLLVELSTAKREYDRVADALRQVNERGYGIVVPSINELTLEKPEVVRQGGRSGVRLKASAPSIHMMRANIETVVSPVVGTEQQSEDLINYLLKEFEGDESRIWQSNIFGKSLHELVNEGLNSKLNHMPDDAREKLRETLQRIINEGSGGLICIIL